MYRDEWILLSSWWSNVKYNLAHFTVGQYCFLVCKMVSVRVAVGYLALMWFGLIRSVAPIEKGRRRIRSVTNPIRNSGWNPRSRQHTSGSSCWLSRSRRFTIRTLEKRNWLAGNPVKQQRWRQGGVAEQTRLQDACRCRPVVSFSVHVFVLWNTVSC